MKRVKVTVATIFVVALLTACGYDKPYSPPEKGGDQEYTITISCKN